MLRITARKKIYAIAAVAAFLLLLNLLIAATGLDRAGEERFYKDVYSVIGDVLPNAKIPFQDAKHNEFLNSLGCRGPETTAEKPAGRLRLLSLGDSTTFGFAQEREEAYTALLGRRLEPIGPWEALNCGIPGTNILQHRLLYDLKFAEFRPDIVLVYIVPNAREDLDALRQMYDRRGTDDAGPLKRVQRFFRGIPLYRLLLHKIKGTVSAQVRNQVELINQAHRGPDQQEYMAEGFKTDLQKLRARIVGGSAVPLWVWCLNRTTLTDLAQKGISGEGVRRYLIENGSYYRVFDRFVAAHKDASVNLFPAAIAAVRNGETIMRDEVHPNQRGHEIFAQAIWEELEPLARSAGRQPPE